jgi:hypothetical protein
MKIYSKEMIEANEGYFIIGHQRFREADRWGVA